MVHGSLAERCRAVALEAARAVARAGLEATESTLSDPTLGSGAAGQAVALHHLEGVSPGAGFEKVADRLLEAAVDMVAREDMTVGLMQGFTGIAWAMVHTDPSEEQATDQIDDVLVSALGRPGWPGEFDLVSGLTGIGVYALERFPRGRGEELLGLVIDRLEEKAEPGRPGLRWFTPPEFILAARLGRAPYGFYNFGMAHGLPGIVALLAGIEIAGIGSRKTRNLLEGAVDHLLSARLEDDSPATWPYFMGREVEVAPSRLAWCYGDPGIVTALYSAARALQREDWLRAAATAAQRMLGRSPEEGRVQGASLCHGTAGLALMYARLAQVGGDAAFAQGACGWVESTLALRDADEALGFSVWDPAGGEERGDVQGPGLLAGVAGVALSLAAASSETEPGWDRFMLLSAPPQAERS